MQHREKKVFFSESFLGVFSCVRVSFSGLFLQIFARKFCSFRIYKISLTGRDDSESSSRCGVLPAFVCYVSFVCCGCLFTFFPFCARDF